MPSAARDAAYNNAAWCDAVCRGRDVQTTFRDRAWSAHSRSPQAYPDAVSLDPAATVDDVLRLVDTGPGCSVKDSFSSLDLRSRGFAVLFDAQWIHREPGRAGSGPRLPWHVVSTPAELAGFAAAHGNRDAFTEALLAAGEVRLLAASDNAVVLAGVVLNRSGSVVGVSNLFTSAAGPSAVEPRSIWGEVVAVAAQLFPGSPLVGYESGDDLRPAVDAGFRTVGPLRVWLNQNQTGH